MAHKSEDGFGFGKTDTVTPRAIMFYSRGKVTEVWRGSFKHALISISNMRKVYAGEPTDFQIMKV